MDSNQKEKLEKLEWNNDKFRLIFMWVKQKQINLHQFCELFQGENLSKYFKTYPNGDPIDPSTRCGEVIKRMHELSKK